MTTALNAAIVRIRDIEGRVVGAGFLATERHVLTCAHVVTAALGLPGGAPVEQPGAAQEPRSPVHLDLPLLPPASTLTARVRHWRPTIDLAGLELTADPPAGSGPVRLVTADDLDDDLWGHAFRAFGFPSGYEDGVWASGLLRGRTGAGWVQIEDVKRTGYFVAPGFSGGPVWDDALAGVVGMIVAADAGRGVRAAFLLPADVLASAWPDVVHTHPPPPASGQSDEATPTPAPALPGRREAPAGPSGGVRIGDVAGGIAGAIIAGGDVTVGTGARPRTPAAAPPPGRAVLTKLRQVLTGRFSEGELRTLCFDLGVDYEILPGRGKADKARELVEYLQHRDQIPALVDLGRVQRPDIAWDDVLKAG